MAAIAPPLQACDTGAARRSWPDGTSATPLLNVPAGGLAAACRSCRAGSVPRAPVPGFFVQDSSDLAHTRRRGPRTPGHNTNE